MYYVGLKALGSLRMEKAYRDFGHDVDNTDTLVEAGLAFTADFDKASVCSRQTLACSVDHIALPVSCAWFPPPLHSPTHTHTHTHTRTRTHAHTHAHAHAHAHAYG